MDIIDKLNEEHDEALTELNKWNELMDEFNVDSRVDVFNMIYILKEENEDLQLLVKEKKDYWEGEHSNLWFGVFGVLNDAGYGPTSTGQLIRFIKDIIEEKEALEKLNNLENH
mgnify:CR=1 FL=1